MKSNPDLDALDKKITRIDQRYVEGRITLPVAMRLMRRAWLRTRYDSPQTSKTACSPGAGNG